MVTSLLHQTTKALAKRNTEVVVDQQLLFIPLDMVMNSFETGLFAGMG